MWAVCFLVGKRDHGLERQRWEGGVRKRLSPCESCCQNLLHFPLRHLFVTIIRFRLWVYVDPCLDPIGSSSVLRDISLHSLVWGLVFFFVLNGFMFFLSSLKERFSRKGFISLLVLSGLAHTCCLLGWELGPPLYVAVSVLPSSLCSPSPVLKAQFLCLGGVWNWLNCSL